MTSSRSRTVSLSAAGVISSTFWDEMREASRRVAEYEQAQAAAAAKSKRKAASPSRASARPASRAAAAPRAAAARPKR